MTAERDPRHDPIPDGKPCNDDRGNRDVERDAGRDERAPPRERGTGRTVEPEDEDRRVRPGESRPFGTMP